MYARFWVSYFLARLSPRYATEKRSNDGKCKIHRMDKICLELDFLRNLKQLCCKL